MTLRPHSAFSLPSHCESVLLKVKVAASSCISSGVIFVMSEKEGRRKGVAPRNMTWQPRSGDGAAAGASETTISEGKAREPQLF